MTTVIADFERLQMAADTRCTGGGPICNVQKIHAIGESIVGFAGDAFAAHEFMVWLHDRRKKPPNFEEEHDCFIALQLTPLGLFLWNGRLVPMPIQDRIYAIGSGSQAAMQSARRGATLVSAITDACDLDEGSGGSVQTMTLEVKNANAKTKRRRANRSA